MNCKTEDFEQYDVIVVGGGLGGLSSAALLAGHGYKVVLFEQHCNVGGYASRFCRKAPDGDPFHFEASIHTIAGCEEDGAVRQVLREAGAEGDVEFLDLSQSCMKIVISDRVLNLPTRQEEFMEMIAGQFPAERRSIERFFSDLNRIWDLLPATQSKPLFDEPAGFDPELAHRLSQPLSTVLSSYFLNQRIFRYLYSAHQLLRDKPLGDRFPEIRCLSEGVLPGEKLLDIRRFPDPFRRLCRSHHAAWW